MKTALCFYIAKENVHVLLFSFHGRTGFQEEFYKYKKNESNLEETIYFLLRDLHASQGKIVLDYFFVIAHEELLRDHKKNVDRRDVDFFTGTKKEKIKKYLKLYQEGEDAPGQIRILEKETYYRVQIRSIEAIFRNTIEKIKYKLRIKPSIIWLQDFDLLGKTIQTKKALVLIDYSPQGFDFILMQDGEVLLREFCSCKVLGDRDYYLEKVRRKWAELLKIFARYHIHNPGGIFRNQEAVPPEVLQIIKNTLNAEVKDYPRDLISENFSLLAEKEGLDSDLRGIWEGLAILCLKNWRKGQNSPTNDAFTRLMRSFRRIF